MSKIVRLLVYLLVILTIFVMSAVPVMAEGASVLINLRVTGSGPVDIIPLTSVNITSGNVTVGDITVDKQTAMGALIYYCQENGENITVADYGEDIYVVQIGDNAADYNNWVYAYNEIVNWDISATDQAVADNDSVHWFNYTLNCYQLLLEIDKTDIMSGENITATVTWTTGNGTTELVENADVYVSDATEGGYPVASETSVGLTNASGQLTFTWDDAGQFWPYAEASDNRTSIYQYPVPTFVVAGAPVSIDLRVTGSGPEDIIPLTSVNITSGNITEDGVTVDKQTAMGALIYYCQQHEPEINIEVTTSYGSPYVVQIGVNATDYNNWMYAYNEDLIWVGADVQAVDNGDHVHWFNSTLSCYQLLLEINYTSIVQGENITATVTWTDGNGSTRPVEGAEIYVSDDTDAFGYPVAPGTLIDTGTTNADGQLTFTWDEIVQFWPYAEASDDRTSIFQYPVPSFECVEPSYSIDLYEGWNFISTPKKLEDGYNTVAQVFRNINTDGHSIFRYDASAEIPWGDGMSNDDQIEPLDGIWIYSIQEDTVNFVFDTYPMRVPPTKQLYAGWNAIGFSDTEDSPANSALTSVEAQWAYLFGFDADAQEYEASIINNTASGDHAENEPMYPGRGYWLYMISNGELAAIGM